VRQLLAQKKFDACDGWPIYGYLFPSSRGLPLYGLGNDIVFTQASGTVARQWLDDKPLAAMSGQE
jgi:hypothetical protein